MKTKSKLNKRSIMLRAHALRREGLDMSSAMRRAWAEARNATKPALILPPTVAALKGVADAVRLLRNSRIEFGIRLRADIGLRITPMNGGAGQTYARTAEAALLATHAPLAPAPSTGDIMGHNTLTTHRD